MARSPVAGALGRTWSYRMATLPSMSPRVHCSPRRILMIPSLLRGMRTRPAQEVALMPHVITMLISLIVRDPGPSPGRSGRRRILPRFHIPTPALTSLTARILPTMAPMQSPLADRPRASTIRNASHPEIP